MTLPPNVYMRLIHPFGDIYREKPSVGQVWGPNAIPPEVLGGCTARRGWPF